MTPHEGKPLSEEQLKQEHWFQEQRHKYMMQGEPPQIIAGVPFDWKQGYRDLVGEIDLYLQHIAWFTGKLKYESNEHQYWKGLFDGAQAERANAEAKLTAAEARCKMLEDAMRRYGEHDARCRIWEPSDAYCNCGYAQALSPEAQP